MMVEGIRAVARRIVQSSDQILDTFGRLASKLWWKIKYRKSENEAGIWFESQKEWSLNLLRFGRQQEERVLSSRNIDSRYAQIIIRHQMTRWSWKLYIKFWNLRKKLQDRCINIGIINIYMTFKAIWEMWRCEVWGVICPVIQIFIG
jgi:hypothetical protein